VTNPVGGVREPDRLAAVARAELHGHLRDQDLNAVVGTLRIACRVPIAVVNIVSENLQTYPAEVGVGAPCTSVPDGLSFCAAVVDTCIPLSVSDARAHPVYCRNPMVLSGVIGAYAGVPLVDDGFILGSVSIFDGAPRESSPWTSVRLSASPWRTYAPQTRSPCCAPAARCWLMSATATVRDSPLPYRFARAPASVRAWSPSGSVVASAQPSAGLSGKPMPVAGETAHVRRPGPGGWSFTVR
jgi:hypothetical protein